MRILIWGFPKIRGTILGVPIIRIIVFWGLYWGSPILGNYHLEVGRSGRLSDSWSCAGQEDNTALKTQGAQAGAHNFDGRPFGLRA